MGWLFSHPDRESLVKYLRYRITRPDYCEQGVIREDEVSVIGNTMYALFRRHEHCPSEEGWTKCIFVYLLKGSPQYRGDHLAWGYKDMDETSGPRQEDCPQWMLKLSDCEVGYATEWKKRCWEHHARRKAAAALKPGVYRMTKEPEGQKEWLDTHFPGRRMRFDGKYWGTLGGSRVRGARRSWGMKYEPEKIDEC